MTTSERRPKVLRLAGVVASSPSNILSQNEVDAILDENPNDYDAAAEILRVIGINARIDKTPGLAESADNSRTILLNRRRKTLNSSVPEGTASTTSAPSTDGIDTVARDLARTAQTAADDAQGTADNKDDAFDWATEGNSDAIPAAKLANAPASGDDAYDWATEGNNDLIPDSKIPPSIMRDAEFTAAAVRGLLNLSAVEVNDLLVGAQINGQVLQFTDNNGDIISLTIPNATPGLGDGVVQSGSIDEAGNSLTLLLADGTPITITIPDILKDATPSFSDLEGMIRDDQIPASIMRDAEFNAASVRGLLGLSAVEVDDLLVGAQINGQVLRFTDNSGNIIPLTIPTATPGLGDGVVASGAFNADQTELILILDTGTPITIDVPAALRAMGGGGLTPSVITGLDPVDPPNSVDEYIVSQNGVLKKTSRAQDHGYIASSVGVGPRLLPTPTADDAGKIVSPTGETDEHGNYVYGLVLVGGAMVIDGPVDAVAALDRKLQWNPANRRVEICRNNGHTVEATEGTWDYMADRNDFAVERSRQTINNPTVGNYIYDEGSGHFYNYVVVAVDSQGDQVLGWAQVNPSTALAASRRTTGILVYWLGDQVSDAAALAALGARHGTYDVTAQDAFYLRNDAIRRLETFTEAGTYIDNWEWLPMQKPPVPRPVSDGDSLVGHDGDWVSQPIPIPYEIVTELPTAMAGADKLVYLVHDYAIGGLRQDANIRFSRVGGFTGYSDPRLGTPVGTLSEPGPIVSILVIADNDGLITRYDVVRFIDQESAVKHDEIALGPDGNVPLYTLGEPYQHGHVWERRFIGTEPQGLRLDTQYKVNLGRTVDATFFFTDGSGIVYRNSFYELIEIVPGEFIYDAISSLRRVHTSGIGEPTTPPIRTGEDYTDDLGRKYVGLVEIVETDDSADGTPVLHGSALYVRKPAGLQEVLDVGTGAWWWQDELGVGKFNQFESDTLASLVRNKNWNGIWTLVADTVTPASVQHVEAVAIRDHSIFLGGFATHAEALSDAALRVSQSEFTGGLRIFYGKAIGNEDTIPNADTRGIYELTAYTAAVIMRTRQGIWVGPLATEARVQELIEAAAPVRYADQAAAEAATVDSKVIQWWPA